MIPFWVAVLALTVFLYVTLDGFDLGVGMLLPLARDETQRRGMLVTIAPVWDGNETWLVLNAAVLFGVFPLTYATLLSAFYLPLTFMLVGLIFRGVAFEYREKATRTRPFWDQSFIAGSYVASFLQGTAVGALVHGLPMEGVRYVGGAFGWLSPFALLCGVGLCLGYALIGAAWLTYKSRPDIREFAFRIMPPLMIALLIFLVLVFALALKDDLSVLRRWLQLPELYVFPGAAAVAAAMMLRAIRRRRELVPFLCAMVVFAAALATLWLSFYPYMIPFAITTTLAAAPASSQTFMFWGIGAFVLPITLVYTLVIYFIFKGKVEDAPRGY
jgi:cytochrome d ubiquinol oxidase subunit II